MDKAIQSVRSQYPGVYLIHYMDDILWAYADRLILQETLQKLEEALQSEGLKIAPEKIQVNPPITYLGRLLNSETVTHQPLQLRTDHLNTLNDFQKLLGDINWIRPFLRLTTAELKPLLQGDADPSSPRALTPEAKGALAPGRTGFVTGFVRASGSQIRLWKRLAVDIASHSSGSHRSALAKQTPRVDSFACKC